jgi:hypothetical protein
VSPGRAAGSSIADAGGAFDARAYSYDGRGNRIGETREDCGYADTYGNSQHPDWLTRQASQCANSLLTHDYAYDRDGRVSKKSWAVDSSGDAGTVLVLSPADLGPGSNGGLETVYKSISVNGATYGYFYDASNRRRLKTYPAGPSDEYFHDFANELLVDQGNDSVLSATTPPPGRVCVVGRAAGGNRCFQRHYCSPRL